MLLLLMLMQLLVGRVHYERCRIHNLLIVVSVALSTEAIHGLVWMTTRGALLAIILLVLMVWASGRLVKVVAGDAGRLICRLLLLIALSSSVISRNHRCFTLVCFVGFV